jgi:CPA1 family monovalent cation:H+ antiporter
LAVPNFTPFEVAAILIALATILGYVNYRFIGLPHTIGLTVTGALASLAVVGIEALVPALPLEQAERSFLQSLAFSETLLRGMLSFLLFAGALHVDLASVLARKWTVGVLATAGVAASTALVGFGFKAITLLLGFDVSLLWCLVFGALISPTDPVAVLGILRSAGVPKILEAKIGGESLFNDGIGIVLFSILLTAARGSDPVSIVSGVELFALEAGGGLVLGLLLGGAGFALMKTIDEHNLEILITLAIVMGGYALAQRLHVSGPIAMAIAGLLIGNPAVKHAMSDHTRDNLLNFWSLLDEILNSVLFLAIGLEVITIAIGWPELSAGLLAIPVVLAARALGRLPLRAPGTLPGVRARHLSHAGLGRPARRHLDRARAYPPLGQPSGPAPDRDLRRRGLLGRGPGHHGRPRRPPPLPPGGRRLSCPLTLRHQVATTAIRPRFRDRGFRLITMSTSRSKAVRHRSSRSVETPSTSPRIRRASSGSAIARASAACARSNLCRSMICRMRSASSARTSSSSGSSKPRSANTLPLPAVTEVSSLMTSVPSLWRGARGLPSGAL